MIHALKTLPEYFEAVLENKKTFELRKNDRDFKVGDYTKEGISYSNDNYVYFVKRVELPEKAYADEKYEDVFSSFEDNMKSEKYNDICKEYVDKVVVNEKIVSKYSFINAFLSDFVDTRKSNTNTTTSN